MSHRIIPGISDHEIDVIDSISRPKIAKAAKRKIYKWYSVYWIETNENLSQFKKMSLNWRQTEQSKKTGGHELKQHQQFNK